MMRKSNLQPIEILLVEDNPGDVYLTTDLLQQSKIANTLHTVTDGEDALRYLRNERPYENVPVPDLVLLDLNLPKKDGREVLSDIKRDPRLKAIPVVVLTSSDAERDVLDSYEAHANSYVNKPVQFEAFVSVIRTIEDFWLSIVRLPHRESSDQQ